MEKYEELVMEIIAFETGDIKTDDIDIIEASGDDWGQDVG